VVHTNAKVLGVAREGTGAFTVRTARGTLKAGRVILATNGYTDGNFPWFQRRIITIHTAIAVSEPLEPALIRAVLPSGRTFIDTRMNPVSIRPMPDGRRLQFTAARGLFAADNAAKAREIRDAAAFAVPALKDVRIGYCWTGRMGFTFDKLPHVGEHDGVLYAMGYCGVGMPMATWLGHKLARRILGAVDAATGLDGRAFPTRPFYTGNPWFLPMIVRWYGYKDRHDLRRARRARTASPSPHRPKKRIP
jgi:glycine/D-amino acid oxidase-like deaminating enzyme